MSCNDDPERRNPGCLDIDVGHDHTTKLSPVVYAWVQLADCFDVPFPALEPSIFQRHAQVHLPCWRCLVTLLEVSGYFTDFLFHFILNSRVVSIWI